MESEFDRKKIKKDESEDFVLERQKNIAVLLDNLKEFIQKKNKDLKQDKIELIEDFFTNLRKLTEILNNQKIREKILSQKPLDFDFLTFHFDVRDDENSINKIIDFLDKFEFLFKKFGFSFKKVLFVSVNQEIKEIKEVIENEWVTKGVYKRGYQILVNKEELISKIQDEAKKLNILKILTKLKSLKLSKEGKIIDDPLFYFNDYLKFLLKEYESFKNKKEVKDNIAVNNQSIKLENEESKSNKRASTNFDFKHSRDENFNEDLFIQDFLQSEEKEKYVSVDKILPEKLLNFYYFLLNQYGNNKFSSGDLLIFLDEFNTFGIKDERSLKKNLTKLETYLCIKKVYLKNKDFLYELISPDKKRKILKLNILRRNKVFIFLDEDNFKENIFEAEKNLSDFEKQIWNIIKEKSKGEFISVAGHMFPDELLDKIGYNFKKLNDIFESFYRKNLLDKGYMLKGPAALPIYKIRKNKV